MILPISAFFVALVLGLVLVPALAKWVAAPWGLLDQPDKNRKLHSKAIPLVGGIAIFVAVTLTVILALCFGSFDFFNTLIVFRPGDPNQLIGLLAGSAFLLLVGIVDDSYGLRGRQKLLGQIISIGILIAFGFNFEKMTIGSTNIEFGVFSFLIVFLWCLAVTNSINLLDGADGFAATIGIIMSLAMSVMAIYQGRTIDAIIVLAVAGALLGFLRYNFPPARVFLGDAGSMLIGFLLAAISIRCTLKQATTYAFFAPIALLAIPFLDTAAAIIRRKLTGRSVFSVDRGHLHHSLAKRGFSERVSLVWVAFLCATTAAGGVISLISQQAEYALASIAIVTIVMIFGGLFGGAELELITKRAVSIGRSFFRRNRITDDDNFHQSSVQLQGNRNWTDVWDELCEFSDDHELNQITFDINLPWLHESFHANRRRTDIKQAENDEWYAEVPLIVDGLIFGRVNVTASKSCRFSHHDVIINLMKLTSDIEPVLSDKAGMNNPESTDAVPATPTNGFVEPSSESPATS